MNQLNPCECCGELTDACYPMVRNCDGAWVERIDGVVLSSDVFVCYDCANALEAGQ